MRRRCWSSWRSGPPTGRERGPRTGRVGRCRSRAPPRLVLVVDQFEELFTAGGDADAARAEREAFIAALHAAATVPVGPAETPAGAGGRGGARGFPRPPHRLSAVEGGAGRRAVHGRADERGRIAARGDRACRRGRPGGGARPGRGGDRRAARRGRGRAGQRRAAADVAGDGRHLGTPRGQRADPARLPACGRGRRRGQPQRPGRLRRPDQPAERRGAPGIHPADRHHPGWPVRAAPVQPGRSALRGSTDGGRHRRGHRRLQRPASARPRTGQRRDLP